MASKNTVEQVRVQVFNTPKDIAKYVAQHIAQIIRSKNAQGQKAVLGLATGSTPVGVYQELVRLHKEEGLDFTNVISFNLDEYYPMTPDATQSYHRFMDENLFDYINIPKENINIPDGTVPRDQVLAHCQAYEDRIRAAGGIDFQLLGIGRDGHIAFNEPGSDAGCRTRMVVLDEITRKDASASFYGEENVPREALTMGVSTIMAAREIILIATGEGKAKIVSRAIEERCSANIPATYLHSHSNCTFIVDKAAAYNLTRERTPWLVQRVQWDMHMAKRAVIYASNETKKGILELELSDFHQLHLHDLVHAYGSADELCHKVYEDLNSKIKFPRELIRDKRVLIFSPHPDDDVICMGASIDKLRANGNNITVAYMTNGSVAVADTDVRRHLRFSLMTSDLMEPSSSSRDHDDYKPLVTSPKSLDKGVSLSQATERTVHHFFKLMAAKTPGEPDAPAIQRLKGNIRLAEAISALEVYGLSDDNTRFLDLPFYRTGTVKKNPISADDVEIVFNLLEEVKPDHIFVAGDLTDPHGTHRMCYFAIYDALQLYTKRFAPVPEGGISNGHVAADGRPMIWLYRGAWQEWAPHDVDVFIPMSKSDMDKKIQSIFKHQSQKDRALYPGSDPREFWQRARDRNMSTAADLDRLGLTKFHAVEAFVCSYTMPA